MCKQAAAIAIGLVAGRRRVAAVFVAVRAVRVLRLGQYSPQSRRRLAIGTRAIICSHLLHRRREYLACWVGNIRHLQGTGHAAVANGDEEQEEHGKQDLERVGRGRRFVVEDVDAHRASVEHVQRRGRAIEPRLVAPELGMKRHEQRARQSFLHELAVVTGRFCMEKGRPGQSFEHTQ